MTDDDSKFVQFQPAPAGLRVVDARWKTGPTGAFDKDAVLVVVSFPVDYVALDSNGELWPVRMDGEGLFLTLSLDHGAVLGFSNESEESIKSDPEWMRMAMEREEVRKRNFRAHQAKISGVAQ